MQNPFLDERRLRAPIRATLLAGLALTTHACGGPSGSAEPGEGSSAPAPTSPAPTSPAPTSPAPAEDPHAGHDHPPGEGHAPPEVAAAPDPATVVARIGEEEILASEVEERIAMIIAAQTGGRGVPPDQMAGIRAQLTPPLVEELVNERLLDEDADAAEVSVTPEECRAEFQGMLETFLLTQKMSREEYAEQLLANEGLTIEAFVEQRSQDEVFARSVRQTRLLEHRFPEELGVTEADVAARYEDELEAIWSVPATVRASHILFEIPEDPEQAAAARTEAESVLALARAEGADFAALAREHSDGPSGPRGGDLGYFTREGMMVEPFAAAAFALEPSQVSELVETQFGLHVIQVTDRREGRVIALEEAAPSIERSILVERIPGVREKHLESLREGRDIEIL